MARIIIYFQDLKDEAQDEIRQAVRDEFIAEGELEPRRENETQEDFEERLGEVIEDHINRNNFSNEFFI